MALENTVFENKGSLSYSMKPSWTPEIDVFVIFVKSGTTILGTIGIRIMLPSNGQIMMNKAACYQSNSPDIGTTVDSSRNPRYIT